MDVRAPLPGQPNRLRKIPFGFPRGPMGLVHNFFDVLLQDSKTYSTHSNVGCTMLIPGPKSRILGATLHGSRFGFGGIGSNDPHPTLPTLWALQG